MRPVLYQRARPNTLDGYVFVDDNMENKFREWVKNRDLPNIILTGSPGTGKTSLAYILCNELGIPNEDILYIRSTLSNGIDTIRDKVVPFVELVSHTEQGRVVIMDECLHEDEKVRVGTVENWVGTPLNELEYGIEYPIVSFNMETGEFENDTGKVISDKTDEVYEVQLSDGKVVIVTTNHPFIVEADGKFVEKTIDGGLSMDVNIVCMSNRVPHVVETKKVRSIKKLGTARVINLTVVKNHTFVTENGIVTHNCDQLSHSAQDGLRNIIEDCMEHARFFLTGNYGHKITDALKSRCQVFHIESLDRDKFILRVAEILVEEGIDFDVETLRYYTDKNYPDMRGIFNDVERFTFDGKLTISESESQIQHSEWMMTAIQNIMGGKYREARDLICKNIQYEEYGEFYRLMYENMDWWAKGDANKQDKVIMTIKEHLVADASVGDREIVLSACLTKLSLI